MKPGVGRRKRAGRAAKKFCGWIATAALCAGWIANPLWAGETASTPDISAPLPDIVSRGFDLYAQAGAEAALRAWVAGGPLDSADFVASQAAGLHRIETFFGKYQGFESIRTQSVTPGIRAVYTVLHFEKGPAFCYMLCYQTGSGGWVISDFDGSTSPRKILPEYGPAGFGSEAVPPVGPVA